MTTTDKLRLQPTVAADNDSILSMPSGPAWRTARLNSSTLACVHIAAGINAGTFTARDYDYSTPDLFYRTLPTVYSEF